MHAINKAGLRCVRAHMCAFASLNVKWSILLQQLTSVCAPHLASRSPVPTASFKEQSSKVTHSSLPVPRAEKVPRLPSGTQIPGISLPLLADDISDACQQHRLEIQESPGTYKLTAVGSTGAGVYPMKCKQAEPDPPPHSFLLL